MVIRRSLAVTSALCAVLAAAVGCGGEDTSEERASDTSGKRASVPSSQRDRPTPSPTPTKEQPKPNGVAELPAQQIAETAIRSYRNASSVRQVTKAPDAYMDITLDDRGNCRATEVIGDMEVRWLLKGDQFWVKPNYAMWKRIWGPKARVTQELIGDRYVLVPTDDPQWGQLTKSCELRKQATLMTSNELEARFTKGKATKVNGVPAITLPYTHGKESGTLYVSTTGKVNLLRMDSTYPTHSSVVVVSDHNEPVSIQPPPDNEVLDISKLK